MEMDKELARYRKEIAEIDSQILKLAKSRFQKAQEIGELKRREKLPAVDLKAEAEVTERSLKLANEIGLDEALTSKLSGMLITKAVEVQGGLAKNRASFLYDIFEKVKELEAKGEKVTRLDVGEPDLSSPVELKDALRDALYGSSFIGYASSKGVKELREAIADDLNHRYGADIDAEQVLITPGGKFAIFAAILATVSSYDHVVIPEPTWPTYGNCVSVANGRVDVIHTLFEDQWDIDMGDVETTFSVRPKLFILCSPNNPTGKIFPAKSLRELVKLAEKRGTYVLADEVYCSYAAVPFESVLQAANSNFIYIGTFSKKYGMTGWRVGYVVSDAKTIAKMLSLIQISVTCVPDFIQRAALRALNMEQEPYDTFAKTMRQRIDTACKELDKLPFVYNRPDGGMYVFPKANVEGFNSNKFAYQLLAEEKVSVAPGDAFGDYHEHFRISLGTNLENIRSGIRKMGKAINGWGKR